MEGMGCGNRGQGFLGLGFREASKIELDEELSLEEEDITLIVYKVTFQDLVNCQV